MTAKELKQKAKYLIGGKKADASAGMGHGIEIVFEQGNLKSIKESQTDTFSLRLFENGKIGVSAGNDSSNPSLDQIVKDASDLSKYGREDNFDLPAVTQKISNPVIYDPEIEKLKVDDLIQIGKKMIDKIKQKEPGMIVNFMNFAYGTGEGVFVNSNGVENHSRGSSVSFGLEFSKVEHGDFFQLYGETSAIRFKDLNYNKVVDGLLQKAEWGKKIADVKAGKYPVIFSPEASAELFEFILGALNGKSVNEKTSRLAGFLGKQSFDKRLTITDDPTIDFGVGSYSLDDEGVPGVKKNLVENGVVKSFYYDLHEAAKAGVVSTGNGSRSAFKQAVPANSNVIISAGEKPFAELLKNTKRGIMANFMLGGGQSNPYNGDFQFSLNLGYLIENGKIMGRVKNVAIAGNVFDLLRNNLIWLSADRETMGAFTAPYICLDGVAVTSK